MRACLLLVCLLFSAVSNASARRALDEFARGLQSFEASFSQVQLDANGDMSKPATGILALKRPNQFRFDYLEPYKQRVIADGNRVWTFDEDLEQVSVRAQGAEMQSNPLTVLLDLRELDKRYVITELGKRGERSVLELKPKDGEGSFERVELHFIGSQFSGMGLIDNFGQNTELTFSGARRNKPIAADRFKFSPPPGVDVIGEVAPDAEVTPLRD